MCHHGGVCIADCRLTDEEQAQLRLIQAQSVRKPFSRKRAHTGFGFDNPGFESYYAEEVPWSIKMFS
jgi:hypothetical protein